MKGKYFSYLIIVVLFLFLALIPANASNINIDPNVLMVSTGPICEDCLEGRILFRLIVTLSEVSMNLYVQKISYGDENCCKEVLKTFEIYPDEIEGKFGLFNVSDISWKSFDSFSFKGNSAHFLVTDLDGEYKCIRKSKRP